MHHTRHLPWKWTENNLFKLHYKLVIKRFLSQLEFSGSQIELMIGPCLIKIDVPLEYIYVHVCNEVFQFPVVGRGFPLLIKLMGKEVPLNPINQMKCSAWSISIKCLVSILIVFMLCLLKGVQASKENSATEQKPIKASLLDTHAAITIMHKLVSSTLIYCVIYCHMHIHPTTSLLI